MAAEPGATVFKEDFCFIFNGPVCTSITTVFKVTDTPSGNSVVNIQSRYFSTQSDFGGQLLYSQEQVQHLTSVVLKGQEAKVTQSVVTGGYTFPGGACEYNFTFRAVNGSIQVDRSTFECIP